MTDVIVNLNDNTRGSRQEAFQQPGNWIQSTPILLTHWSNTLAAKCPAQIYHWNKDRIFAYMLIYKTPFQLWMEILHCYPIRYTKTAIKNIGPLTGFYLLRSVSCLSTTLVANNYSKPCFKLLIHFSAQSASLWLAVDGDNICSPCDNLWSLCHQRTSVMRKGINCQHRNC